MRLTLSFYECEHNGDLNTYVEDVASAGGQIIEADVDPDSETGTVVVEVADKKAFVEAFRKTSAFGYLNNGM